MVSDQDFSLSECLTPFSPIDPPLASLGSEVLTSLLVSTCATEHESSKGALRAYTLFILALTSLGFRLQETCGSNHFWLRIDANSDSACSKPFWSRLEFPCKC